MRKVFLENLPRKRYKGKDCIDWENSKGYEVNFVYDDINGKLIILDYIKNKQILKIKYSNEYLITTSSLLKCKLARLLGKKTSDFKLNIGQNIKDSKRDLTILSRYKEKDNTGRTWKCYKYKCNKCGYDKNVAKENHLLGGRGCPLCCHNPQKVIEGINDIATTAPWMVKYFKNIDNSRKYTKMSNKKIICKCPNCGFEKEISIDNLNKYGFNCSICGNKTSYSERLTGLVLNELNLNFVTQLSNCTFKWIGKYRYDFYFKYNNEEYIIETHGIQHYKTGFVGVKGRTLEEEQENDKNKYELAIHNGIKPKNYIVIDCRYSEFEFIKNNIINSRLNEIFDLSEINWKDIEINLQNSLIKEVCEYWNIHKEINKENLTTTYLGKLFNSNRGNIRKYLKIGNKLGWCNYNPEYEHNKTLFKGKIIEIFKNNKSLGTFNTITELSKYSFEMFGEKLYVTEISKACKNNKSYKGFTFKYVNQFEL